MASHPYNHLLRNVALQILGLFYACIVVQIMFWRIVWNGRDFFAYKERKRDHPLLRDGRFGFHQYVKLNDINLHYVDNRKANKPTIIFLHGFMQFWYSWHHQLADLSQSYRTIAVDLRGYGLSEQFSEVGAYHFDKVVNDLVCLIHHINKNKHARRPTAKSKKAARLSKKQLIELKKNGQPYVNGNEKVNGHKLVEENGIINENGVAELHDGNSSSVDSVDENLKIEKSNESQKVIIVGYNLGGTLAWILAQRYPELIQKVMVISTPHPQAHQKLTFNNWAVFLQSWFSIFAQVPLIPELYLLSYDLGFFSKIYCRAPGSNKPPVLNEEELECHKALFAYPDAITHALNYYRANSSHTINQWKEQEQVQVPLMLVWGRQDVQFNKQLLMESMNYAAKVQVEVVSHCDRYVHLDDPTHFNYILRRFIA